MSMIPGFFYPTTVALVDDDVHFLKAFELEMKPHLAYCLYNNPQQALQALQCADCPQSLATSLLATPSELDDYELQPAEHWLRFQLTPLHQLIYNAKRFEQFTVVIVDYTMPSMSGVEFCRALKGSALKKIMLTGRADYQVAVEAFNEGIIDKFITKDGSDLFSKVHDAIQALQKHYFLTLSDTILSYLPATASCLSHPAFNHFFNQLCEQQHAVEFYLLDSAGSFLLLDEQAKPSWLIVKTAAELTEYAQVAEDNEAPEKVIKALAEKTHLPFFLSEADYRQPVSAWPQFIHPAQAIPNLPDYYYSLLTDSPQYALDYLRINAYHHYLKARWQT